MKFNLGKNKNANTDTATSVDKPKTGTFAGFNAKGFVNNSTKPVTENSDTPKSKFSFKKETPVSEKEVPATGSAQKVAPPANTASERLDDTALFTETDIDETTTEKHKSQPDEYADEDVQLFKKQIETLTENLDNKDMVGTVLKSLMLHMKQKPHIGQYVLPEDIGIMVKALRNSYGSVIMKKDARSEKKKKADMEVQEVADLMGDIDMGSL